MFYEIHQDMHGRWFYALYDAGSLVPFITGGNYKHRSSALRGAKVACK